MAGKDRISRYEFAKSIARAFGHDESTVIPVVDRTGLRQPNSCLECRRLKVVTGKDAWSIGESLDQMIVNRSVPSRVKWTCQ